MPPQNPGQKVYVTAGVAVRHGAPAADDGYVGIAWKQDTPDVKSVAIADLDLIPATKKYLLVVTGEHEIDATNLPGIAKGALVYIDPDDNLIGPAQAGNNVVLGKVSALAGERGCPVGKVRVNLNFKA